MFILVLPSFHLPYHVYVCVSVLYVSPQPPNVCEEMIVGDCRNFLRESVLLDAWTRGNLNKKLLIS